MDSADLFHLKHNIEREIAVAIETVLSRNAEENNSYHNLSLEFKSAIDTSLSYINMQLQAQTQDRFSLHHFFCINEERFNIGVVLVNKKIAISPEISPGDIFYIRLDGTIERVDNEGEQHNFYIQKEGTTGKYVADYKHIGTLSENESGLVQFPASGSNFGRYGFIDAGGQSGSENVGQGDHYVTPETAAALYGVIEVSGVAHLSIGDMSSSNGSDPWQPRFQHHAGHGHNGNYSGQELDFRYLNTNNESFQSPNAFNSNTYSSTNNQTLYDTAEIFGFDRRFQGDSGNLNEAINVNSHNNHGHFGRSNNMNNITNLLKIKLVFPPIDSSLEGYKY